MATFKMFWNDFLQKLKQCLGRGSKMDCLLKVYEFLWNANSLKVLNYNTLSPKSMKYKFVYRSMLKVNLM